MLSFQDLHPVIRSDAGCVNGMLWANVHPYLSSKMIPIPHLTGINWTASYVPGIMMRENPIVQMEPSTGEYTLGPYRQAPGGPFRLLMMMSATVNLWSANVPCRRDTTYLSSLVPFGTLYRTDITTNYVYSRINPLAVPVATNSFLDSHFMYVIMIHHSEFFAEWIA